VVLESIAASLFAAERPEQVFGGASAYVTLRPTYGVCAHFVSTRSVRARTCRCRMTAMP
jgi:hypothetical protein